MRETLFQSRWLAVHRIDHWEFVGRPDSDSCVGILAITPEQEIVLVEQFRIPVQNSVIELPAGLVGDEEEHRSESIAETAKRELLEETGFEADNIEKLIVSPTSPGMSSELMHLFLATGLTRVGPGGGVASEDIITHIIPLTDLRPWINDRLSEGTTVDFKIHAALWAAQPFLSDYKS